MPNSEQTSLYCLIGDPVSHSLSPFIMNRAFARNGISATYTTLRVTAESLPQTIDDLIAMGFSGANVTYPHKEAVLTHINHPSERVEVIKAANTLHFTKDGIFGYNTDAVGTTAALKHFGGISLGGKKTIIFGAGGAARAAAFGVLEAGGAMVTFCVRDPSKAESAVSRLRRFFTGRSINLLSLRSKKMRTRREAAISGSDILINATPVGMEPYRTEGSGKAETAPPAPPTLVKDPGLIRPGHCCVDFVYHPRETAFLKTAKERGATRVDGLRILVAQAVEGFRCWTGGNFDMNEMVAALESYIAGGARPWGSAGAGP